MEEEEQRKRQQEVERVRNGKKMTGRTQHIAVKVKCSVTNLFSMYVHPKCTACIYTNAVTNRQ